MTPPFPPYSSISVSRQTSSCQQAALFWTRCAAAGGRHGNKLSLSKTCKKTCANTDSARRADQLLESVVKNNNDGAAGRGKETKGIISD
jgi:hypothetical protein